MRPFLHSLAAPLVGFLVILCASGPAAPAGVADVAPFFDATQRRLVAISGTAAASRGPGCAALVAELFDLAAVARSVAATDNWSVMPPPVRQRMRRAVATRFARECISLVDRSDPAGARIVRVRERPGGVRMTVLAPDRQGLDRTIVWTLRPGSPQGGPPGGRRGWTATDLEADGRSVVSVLRHEFENSLLARQGNVGEAVAHFSRIADR